MIQRNTILASLRRALGRSPVVVLAGPRQCGKTTLARLLVPEQSLNYFDLEDPASLARLDEPMTALDPLAGAGRDRRGATASRPLPGHSCPGRPRKEPRAVPDSRQRLGRFAAADFREFGRSNGTRDHRRVLASRSSGPRRSRPCSYAAGFRAPSWRPTKAQAQRGGRASFRPCWNAISRSGGSACRRSLFSVSGPCSRTTTVKPGMRQSPPEHWG